MSPALNIDSDELSSMSAEIMRGTPKADSLYANTSEDHSFMWDVLEGEIANIPMPEPSVEIQPPLMNQDWEGPNPPGPAGQAAIAEVTEVDAMEGL